LTLELFVFVTVYIQWCYSSSLPRWLIFKCFEHKEQVYWLWPWRSDHPIWRRHIPPGYGLGNEGIINSCSAICVYV